MFLKNWALFLRIQLWKNQIPTPFPSKVIPNKLIFLRAPSSFFSVSLYNFFAFHKFFCVSFLNFFAFHVMKRKKIVNETQKNSWNGKKLQNETEKNEQGALRKISYLRISLEGKGVGIWFFHSWMQKIKVHFLRNTYFFASESL